MEDIAPKLIQLVTDEFRREYEVSNRIQNLLEKVKRKTATYAEAQEYAIEVSRLIGSAYEKHISSAVLPDGWMYYNIASRLIPSSLDENHKLVSQYAADVQTAQNKKANISLKTQVAELDQDRVDGLVELVSNAEQYDDVSKQLQSAYENFSQHIVDETIRKNAEFHYNAGMKPKIVRKAESKCCKWCRALAGEFDYPDVPDDIYRRHENCRCTVEYDPGDGRRQNVHTKKWTNQADSDKLKKRNTLGLLSPQKRRYEPDILIGRDLGAKAKNYTVMDLETGEFFRFAQGSRIQNVEVFAGKGTKTEFRKAQKYADRHGGRPEDWKHVKGHGIIETSDGDRRAEVHWIECECIGKFDFFVKRWEDE